MWAPRLPKFPQVFSTGPSGHFRAAAAVFPVKRIHLEEKRQLAAAPKADLTADKNTTALPDVL